MMVVDGLLMEVMAGKYLYQIVQFKGGNSIFINFLGLEGDMVEDMVEDMEVMEGKNKSNCCKCFKN